MNRLQPGNPAYVIVSALDLTGDLDVGCLRAALKSLVERHDVLRTGIAMSSSELVQRVLDRADLQFEQFDVDIADPDDRARFSQRLVDRAAAEPFDLESGQVMRAYLISWSPRQHQLVLLIHHVAADGWSVGVLHRDLAGCYNAALRGAPGALPALTANYRDHAQAQRALVGTDDFRDGVEFWRSELAGAPTLLELPTDRPRPVLQGFRGSVVRRPIPPGLLDRLSGTAREHNASPFMALLGVLAVVLGRWSGQRDVIIGSPVAGRDEPAWAELVGCFVEMLPIRVDLTGNPTFAELLARVRKATLRAFANQHVPLERIVETISPDRDTSHAPVFQISLTIQDTPYELPVLDKLETGESDVEVYASRWDLAFGVQSVNGAPTLRVEFDTDLFDESTIERVVARFGTLMRSAADNPTARIDDLELVDAEERDLILSRFSPPPEPHGATLGLLELFAHQVRRRPDATAVTDSGRALSYAELDARAGRLAALLHARGVRRGDLVGLGTARSVEAVVAMVGILKAGAAYLPIDPTYPDERIAFMVADAALGLIVGDTATAGRLRRHAPSWICLDTDLDTEPAAEWAGLAAPDPDLPAYVIYTSGSTGRPKGVVVSHGNVASLFAATTGELAFADTDIWMCAHSFSFDFSVWEIWGAIGFGGRVVIASPDTVRDPCSFAEFVAAERVTVLSQTPGAYYQVADRLGADLTAGRSRVRLVVFGGEALDWARVAESATHGRPVEYVNMYGITEGTVHVTWRRADPASLGGVPAGSVGVPLPTMRCQVLDQAGRLAGVGVPGELYISGAGVACGYLNRPDETARRFLRDPQAADPSAIRYRTGDRVKWSQAGELIYLGRLDQQVQVRGHRVECGEIERALLSHPDVVSCVVTLDSDHLVAFVTGAVLTRDPGPLVAHARRLLPGYLVPSEVVLVDEIPVTAHGKIDNAALLRRRDADCRRRLPAERPRTPREERVWSVWRAVLGRDDIGLESNFFEAGGHSFAAVRLQERLGELGCPVDVADVFRFPTVRSLASYLDGQVDPSTMDDAVARAGSRRGALSGLRARARLAGGAGDE